MPAQDIISMSAMDMLTFVLGGKLPESKGSIEKRERKQRNQGIITSVFARRLYTAKSIVQEYIDDLVMSYLPCGEDDVFSLKLLKVSILNDVLNQLFWQAVREEYPQVATSNVRVCEGWNLVGSKREWSTIVPIPDKTNIANNFISRVNEIVCNKYVLTDEQDFPPVSQGEDIIGSLGDERVKTFWNFTHRLHEESLVQLSFCPKKRSSLIKLYFDELKKISLGLFWAGVIDLLPSARVSRNHACIRQGWNVVTKTHYVPTN